MDDFDDFDDILDDLLDDDAEPEEVDEEEEDGEELPEEVTDHVEEDSLDAAMNAPEEPPVSPPANATPVKPMDYTKTDNVISNLPSAKKKETLLTTTTSSTPATVATAESASPVSSKSSISTLSTPKMASLPSTQRRTTPAPLTSRLSTTRTESPMRITKPTKPTTTTRTTPSTTTRSYTSATSSHASRPTKTNTTTSRPKPAAPKKSTPSSSSTYQSRSPTRPLNLSVANKPTKAWLARQGLLPGQSNPTGQKRPGDKLSKINVKRPKLDHHGITPTSIPNRPTKAWLAKIAATQEKQMAQPKFSSGMLQTPNGQTFCYRAGGRRYKNGSANPQRRH